MSLFEKHLKSGFDLGWHRDIPAFTTEDWQAYIELASKLWNLEMRSFSMMEPAWAEEYNSFPSSLWQHVNSNHPREQIQSALTNMVSPVGKIVFSGPDYSEYLLKDIFKSVAEKKWDEATKQKFFEALRKFPFAGSNCEIIDELPPIPLYE